MITYLGFTEEDLILDNVRKKLLPDLENNLLDPGNVFLLYWHFVRVVWMEIMRFDSVVSFGGFDEIGKFLVRCLRFDARFDAIPLFTVDSVKREVSGQVTRFFMLVSYRFDSNMLEFMKKLVLELASYSKCKGFIVIDNEGFEYGKSDERVISVLG